jgi:hypothetical protein
MTLQPERGMIASTEGEEAVPEIERWARAETGSVDPRIETRVHYDADSRTYVIRLGRGMRVLVFRLSTDQVRDPRREEESLKILRRKIADLSSRL